LQDVKNTSFLTLGYIKAGIKYNQQNI